MLPIKAINIFYVVARTNSIARAAEKLSVTPSAVSQQLKNLEMQLGTSLAFRQGRNIQLTEAGERYYESIEHEFDRITEATNRIRGYRAIDTLTIRATPSLSTKWLMPRISSFIKRHPEFDLRLDGTNQPTDFSRESVDIDIRHGEGAWPGLSVEALANEEFFVVCSPSVAIPGSLKASELQNERLIYSIKSQMQWSTWFEACGISFNRQHRRLLFDRSHMAVDAAVAGLGLALESNLMMEREIDENLLCSPVSGVPILKMQTQWIVCPTHHLRRRSVQAFLDWVRCQAKNWSKRQLRPRIV